MVQNNRQLNIQSNLQFHKEKNYKHYICSSLVLVIEKKKLIALKKIGLGESNQALSRQELLEHRVHNASTQESTEYGNRAHKEFISKPY